jgi:hypothetical protein
MFNLLSSNLPSINLKMNELREPELRLETIIIPLALYGCEAWPACVIQTESGRERDEEIDTFRLWCV